MLGISDPFHGQALLESLVEQKMIFGAMEIFHRLGPTGHSDFSLLNAVEPGTFDLHTIGDMKIPGVSLFMRVHELADPVSTFDDMIEVAQNLADDLGGELKDESRSVMTSQTIEHCRLDIRQYQHKHR